MNTSGEINKTSLEYIRLKRERTRNRVVHFLLGILLLTIIGVFVLIWNGKDSSMFIQTVLPLLTTLIGSALGFYFGGSEKPEAMTTSTVAAQDKTSTAHDPVG